MYHSCDCDERPCCEACEDGLRCEDETEIGRPELTEAELRSDAELASSIWRSFGVDKFFLILSIWALKGEEMKSIHARGHSSGSLTHHHFEWHI